MQKERPTLQANFNHPLLKHTNLSLRYNFVSFAVKTLVLAEKHSVCLVQASGDLLATSTNEDQIMYLS